MLSIEKAICLEICSGFSTGFRDRYQNAAVEGITRPNTVVLDGEHLAELAALCRSKTPEGSALLEALCTHAEPLLHAPVDSVVNKTPVDPGISANDYYSLAKYWWPDETRHEGLPYVRHDGEVNVECYSDRFDAVRLVHMVESLQVLSLAAFLSGDSRYAEHAVHQLTTWFLDPETRQTPHFEHAQRVPGRQMVRSAAIIEARHLIYVTEAVLLLEAVKALTAQQSREIRQWFEALLTWLRDSEIGHEAAAANNNIGFWYDLQRMAYAWFIGDEKSVERIALNEVRVRAQAQIDPDGTLPAEMTRAHPQDYVSFTLIAMAQLSRYASQVDVPLWEQREADGRGFQMAHDWLIQQVESRQAHREADLLSLLTDDAVPADGCTSQWSSGSGISDLTLRLGLVNRLAEKRQQMLTQQERHNRLHLEHIQELNKQLQTSRNTIKSLREDNQSLRESNEAHEAKARQQESSHQSIQKESIELREQLEMQRLNGAELLERMEAFEQRHDQDMEHVSIRVQALDERLVSLSPVASAPDQDSEALLLSRRALSRMRRELGSRQHQVETLERRLEQMEQRLNKEQHKNEALMNSRSWRITTPLRNLRHLVGRNAKTGGAHVSIGQKGNNAVTSKGSGMTVDRAVPESISSEKIYDPLEVLHSVTPVNVEGLQQEYREKGLHEVADTFVLYRIIGNDLYPRHRKGQTRDNLRFILENEQPLENCEKRWIVNRIVDASEERAVIELLETHGQKWTHIPFESESYRAIGWDYDSLPSVDFLDSTEFDRLPSHQKKRIQTATYRLKNNYVMNNNGARNMALRMGRKEGKWVLPWDGNCFLTAEAWKAMTTGVTQRPWLKHFVVPMTRLLDNAQLWEEGFQPNPVEEPQLVFRSDTVSDFNDAFCYGRRPKVEMFWHLGIPGKWDDWKDEPCDQPRRMLSSEAFQWGVAGWVARLFSGMGHMETPDSAGAVSRNQHRQDAIMDFLDRIDVLTARHANDHGDMLLEETDNGVEPASAPTTRTQQTPFIFGIALRARSTTNNWALACQNLERTLGNLARQSDADFEVYIVVHDIPEIDTHGLSVTFLEVDFPVSFNDEGRPINDKNRKKRVLGAHLQKEKMQAFYFMGLDADDLLHPDLVKTVREKGSSAGYLIERGYMYDCGSGSIGRCNEHTKRFWEQCGSCAIFYITPEDLPSSESDKQAYFSRLAEHNKYQAVAREHHRELEVLEGYMGVYLVNHGENDWSIYRGRKGSKERYISRNILGEQQDVVSFYTLWPELKSSELQSSPVPAEER